MAGTGDDVGLILQDDNQMSSNAFRTLVATTGGLLWIFIVILPAIHLRLPSVFRTVGWLAVCLPLALLSLGVWRRNAAVAVLGVPLAHLPVLMMYPELVGPQIYGSAAFLAVGIMTIGFLVAALRRYPSADSQPITRPASPTHSSQSTGRVILLQTVAHGLMVTVIYYFVCFHQSTQLTIRASYPGYESTATIFILLTMFVAWAAVVGRHLVGSLGKALWAPASSRAERYRFEAESTSSERVHNNLMWSLLVGTVSGAVLGVLLLLGL
jgi:hypothetical protein